MDKTYDNSSPGPLFDPPPKVEGVVNASVLPKDVLRLSKQCVKMFQHLKKGPATNVELQKLCDSMNPTARRTDIRNELKKHGWDLKLIEKMPDGVNLYGIIDNQDRLYIKGQRVKLEDYFAEP